MVFYVILAAVLGLILLAGAGLYYITAMPGSSFHGAPPPTTEQEQELAKRLRRHVVAIASKEHNVDNYPELERSARYIEKTLSGYGHAVIRQEYESRGHRVRNLEVAISSAAAPAQKVVVVGAHYDSAFGATGANDNGSGSAAVIELARMLKGAEVAEGYELRLVLFVNEEEPYFKTAEMGSWVHARALHASGKQVVAMLSLETLGYYSDAPGSQRYPFPFNLIYPDTGNFIGFVGQLDSRALVREVIESFRRHASFPSEGVAAPGFITGVDWSDHWSYNHFGYPALMITDTALYRYPYYHTPEDTLDKIDYERLARVVTGIERVVRELVGAR